VSGQRLPRWRRAASVEAVANRDPHHATEQEQRDGPRLIAPWKGEEHRQQEECGQPVLERVGLHGVKRAA